MAYQTSLQASLAAFNRQQEKAQEILSAAASSAAASAAQKRSKSAAAVPAAAQQPTVPDSSSPALKGLRPPDPSDWRANAEYYKEKKRVEGLHVGHKMKKVLDLLEKDRRAFTAAEIEQLTLVDLSRSAELQEKLKSNFKVKVEGETYRYQAKIELNGKDDLLRLIRQNKDGILKEDVKDSYAEVETHIEQLKATNAIWVILNRETKTDVLYPNDPRIKIKVDHDFQQRLRKVPIPRDFKDLEKVLKMEGHAPATSKSRQEAAEKYSATVSEQEAKPKRRKVSKRVRHTNDHMPELFQDPPRPPPK